MIQPTTSIFRSTRLQIEEILGARVGIRIVDAVAAVAVEEATGATGIDASVGVAQILTGGLR